MNQDSRIVDDSAFLPSPLTPSDIKTSDLSPQLPSNRSFFLTDQRLSQSFDGMPTEVMEGGGPEGAESEEEKGL